MIAQIAPLSPRPNMQHPFQRRKILVFGIALLLIASVAVAFALLFTTHTRNTWLLENALQAAYFSGLRDTSITVADFSIEDGIFTTYGAWIHYKGGELGPDAIAAGDLEREVLVLPIYADNLPNRGGIYRRPDDTYDKMIIVVFTDTGEMAWATHYPTGQPIDLSDVPQR